MVTSFFSPLVATLDSILGQGCQDVEVILKDGGSTDGSVERWKQENASRPGAERVRIIVEEDGTLFSRFSEKPPPS